MEKPDAPKPSSPQFLFTFCNLALALSKLWQSYYRKTLFHLKRVDLVPPSVEPTIPTQATSPYPTQTHNILRNHLTIPVTTSLLKHPNLLLHLPHKLQIWATTSSHPYSRPLRNTAPASTNNPPLTRFLPLQLLQNTGRRARQQSLFVLASSRRTPLLSPQLRTFWRA